MINYKSYGDLARDISANLQKIPPIDAVVGIPKSGLIPAIMIAQIRNIRVHGLDEFLFVFSARSGKRNFTKPGEEKAQILVVDDSVNTGAELTRTREKLAHLSTEFDFHFCAVYGTDPANPVEPADIVLTHVHQPRVFQWNYRNHISAEHALFDLDGVLCFDPTDEQNDDGEAYLDFLANAAPLTIPAKVISAIVTSRLEKYRAQTEDWLERNGVRYRELIMLDLPSAAERRRRRAHGPFKADIYKGREEFIFVESNWKQAQHIAKAADKPVICTENDTFVFGRDHLEHLSRLNGARAPDESGWEVDLQRRVDLLVDRVVQTDPYAAYWLKQSGIRFDLNRLAGVSPFLKGRIITSSLAQKSRPSTPLAKRRKGKKRVLLISRTFDVEKGAGAAASSARLRQSLAAAGVDVHTLSLDDFPAKNRDDARADQPTSGTITGFWSTYGDGNHWKSIRRRVQQIDPDCVILGAIDGGILSMFDIARLDYPIVWVSRDNWAHTGGCLFKLESDGIVSVPPVYNSFLTALTCDGYKTGCQQCFALKDVRESAKARLNFELKRVVLNYRRDIVFAPISAWMEQMLKGAPLTENHTVVHVNNPIDLNEVRRLDERPTSIRRRFGIDQDQRLVLLAAHSLSNPRKGLKHALDALSSDNRFADVVFVRMGSEKVKDLTIPPTLRCHSLGYVVDEKDKVAIYNEVDATLVPALQESLSVVASDSLCCGTPVVAYNSSGLRSFLIHRKTGYLARKFDVEDLLDGLVWVLYGGVSNLLSVECTAQAQKVFDSVKNTQAMLECVDRAIAQHGSLGDLPVELKTLASTMELMHEEHRYRSDHTRHLNRRIKEVTATKDLNPNKLFDELERTRKKLTQSETRIKQLQAKLKAKARP